MSKEEGLNPKDLIGAKKINLALVPTAGLVKVAQCMGNGAEKYGPFNWREEGKKVQLMTYISASLRHLYMYLDGEEVAQDSGLCHLGHAASGILIAIDAIACDNYVDNRPVKGVTAQLIEDDFNKSKV